MARFCTLFSSSSGNCIYIGAGEGGILIDAGGERESHGARAFGTGDRPEIHPRHLRYP